MDQVFTWAGNSTYIILAATAFWGAYCSIVVWNKIKRKRFKSEMDQNAFLEQVEARMAAGDLNGAGALCEERDQAFSQLCYLAIANRNIGLTKMRELTVERFQRDVLAEIDYYMTWVLTMIKTGPMWGLLGTVLGMMGAFGQLAAQESVKAAELAGNINVALITTAVGLMIAIPLMMVVSAINIRIKHLEDLTGAGLARFFETYKSTVLSSGRG
jgi:biopolymer transport protein ExbB